MRRQDLQVGETYETRQGATVIVMDERPYIMDSSSRYSRRSNFRPTYDGKGSGVAVAIRHVYTTPHIWEPAIFPLASIVPLGTRRAKQGIAMARYDQELEVYRTKSAKCKLLASQLGVSTSAITWSASNGYQVDSTFVEAVERMIRGNQ